MDQTPVYFSYHCNKMLAKHEIKTVHVRKSATDTRRATCALTCTAAGNFFSPMMIYKGKAKGHIATREFQHHADMLDDVLGLGEDSDNESDDNEMLWGEA